MKYLIGPEICWLILYAFAVYISKSNISPDFSWDSFIDKCWFYIPALTVLFFALYWIPGVHKNWLLIRIWVACFIGGHFTLEKLMSAASQQGPGAGMGYLAGLLFMFFILVVGSIVVKVVH